MFRLLTSFFVEKVKAIKTEMKQINLLTLNIQDPKINSTFNQMRVDHSNRLWFGILVVCCMRIIFAATLQRDQGPVPVKFLLFIPFYIL